MGAVVPGSPWAQYLALRPDVADRFYKVAEHINTKLGEYRRAAEEASLRIVNLAENARQIGLAVLECEEMFAGKKLTEDFWKQVCGVFVDSTGQAISREQLLWFAHQANKFPEPITSADQILKGAAAQMLLSGDFDEVSRGPQMMHLPANPLLVLKEQLQFTRLEETWKALKSDVNFCPGGMLRADLRATLAVELTPTKRLLDELWQALGI